MDLAGETLRVRVPRVYDAGVERILRVNGGGDRLSLTGEVGHDYGDRGRIGCLLVARPERRAVTDSGTPPGRTRENGFEAWARRGLGRAVLWLETHDDAPHQVKNDQGPPPVR